MPRSPAALLLIGALAFAAEAPAADDSSSLIAAVKSNGAANVASLLTAGADPNAADADGTSALHWAVHRSADDAITALLGAGADVGRANRYGIRPSYLAAENGDPTAMRLLIDAGADPNATFAEGETLLMTAARTGNVPTIEALIAAGANLNAIEARGGQSSLMWAAAANNGPAVATLIRAGADVDQRETTGEFTALAFAVRAGATDSTRALLDAGADVNSTLNDGTSMLVLATLNAKFEVASVLLDYGADPNAAVSGWTALHEIARVRRWNRGFNLPGPEHDAHLSSLALVRELAASGADVNVRQLGEGRDAGATPFLLATRSLDLPYMQTLLELGADPSLAMDDGTTAVMLAAGVGQGIGSAGSAPGSVEEALAALELTLSIGGGTVNDINTNNETPLHGAMYRGGSLALIDLLVDAGANLEGTVNSRGWTPLRIADGVGLDGLAFVRYPEAAAHLRELMRAQGLPVPPIEWDGPDTVAR